MCTPLSLFPSDLNLPSLTDSTLFSCRPLFLSLPTFHYPSLTSFTFMCTQISPFSLPLNSFSLLLTHSPYPPSLNFFPYPLSYPSLSPLTSISTYFPFFLTQLPLILQFFPLLTYLSFPLILPVFLPFLNPFTSIFNHFPPSLLTPSSHHVTNSLYKLIRLILPLMSPLTSYYTLPCTPLPTIHLFLPNFLFPNTPLFLTLQFPYFTSFPFLSHVPLSLLL